MVAGFYLRCIELRTKRALEAKLSKAYGISEAMATIIDEVARGKSQLDPARCGKVKDADSAVLPYPTLRGTVSRFKERPSSNY